MKKSLLLILGLLLTTSLFAGPVGKEGAKAKALAFLNGTVSQRAGVAKAPRRLQDLSLASSGDAYHVFNIGASNGFVIVSGSDLTPDIIGYTDEGAFDAQNIPDNMKAWLQEYANQIAWVEKNGEQVTESKVRKAPATSTVKSAIAPLIQTRWMQTAPYNGMVPSGCVTGCVATAMAQVLYYCNQKEGFPLGTTTNIPAYTDGNGHDISMCGQIDYFDWANMQLVYTDSEEDEKKTAVAQLMQYCGAAVGMKYGTSSSSNLMLIAEALNKYFGYDQHATNVRRHQYTAIEWENMLYDEVAAGRPVLYSASSSGGGHAFICDGYSVDGYFHINWGWGGTGDGFYLLSVLNPNSTGVGAGSSRDGYTVDQDAVIGIQKPTGYKANDANVCVTSLDYLGTATVSNTESNFKCDIKISLRPLNTYSHEYDMNMGIYDESDNLIFTHSSYYDKNVALGVGLYRKDWMTDYKFNLTILESGRTYKIKPVYRLSGTTEWIAFENSDKYYIQAVAGESTTTFSIVKPTVNLAVSGIESSNECVIDEMATINATITNNGSDYNGVLYLTLSDVTDPIAAYGLNLEAGEKIVVPFSFLLKSTNGYKASVKTMKITTDENELWSGDLTLKSKVAADDTPTLTSTHSLNLDETNTSILGTKLVDKVTLKNTSTTKPYAGFVDLRVFTWTKISEGWSLSGTGTSAQWVEIPADKTIDLVFEKPVVFSSTTKYSVQTRYHHNGGTWETAGPDTHLDDEYAYFAIPAIKTIAADGTETLVKATASYTVPAGAAVVDLRGQSVVTSITPNSNPNCLYLLDESAATPSGISNNVVKGTTAANIVLEGDNDFYTPIDFTATNISYTRQFTSGADGLGNGWSTIMLPFDVETVKRVDTNTTIDWFHSSSDTGKNFWVYQFRTDGKGTVNFDYASSIKANTPYLITVPSDKWGSEFDLRNKDITFSATDVTVKSNEKKTQSGFYYMFTGGSQKQSVAVGEGYVLNAEGSKFKKVEGSALDVPAFQAYFYPSSHNLQSDALAISFVDNDKATDIQSVGAEQVTVDDNNWYTLQGVKLDGKPTEKGIYIYNGKKVAIK